MANPKPLTRVASITCKIISLIVKFLSRRASTLRRSELICKVFHGRILTLNVWVVTAIGCLSGSRCFSERSACSTSSLEEYSAADSMLFVLSGASGLFLERLRKAMNKQKC